MGENELERRLTRRLALRAHPGQVYSEKIRVSVKTRVYWLTDRISRTVIIWVHPGYRHLGKKGESQVTVYSMSGARIP